MIHRVQRTVFFDADDLKLAQIRQIPISTTCRDLFHAFISGTDPEDATIEKVYQEVQTLRSQNVDIQARLQSKEQLLQELEKRKSEKIDAEKAEIEKRRTDSKTCPMCDNVLNPDSVKATIKYGQFANRPVCRRCFDDTWNNHREWFA